MVSRELDLKIILIMTLSGLSPQGPLSVPVSMEFSDRSACLAYVDTQVDAVRAHMKGPVTLTVMRFCDQVRAPAANKGRS